VVTTVVALCRRQTLRVAMIVGPCWFLAQGTYNWSLNATSVSSSTILSTTSWYVCGAVARAASHTAVRAHNICGVASSLRCAACSRSFSASVFSAKRSRAPRPSACLRRERRAALCRGVLRQCGVTSWHCACRAGALARCSSVSLTTAAVTTTPSATPFASSPQPCTVVVDSVRRQCVLHPALCYCGCRYGVYTTLIRKLVPEDGSMHMSTFFGACRLRKQQCFILACAHD
jgi:hypothetical protein